MKASKKLALSILALTTFCSITAAIYDAPPGLVNLDGHSSSPSAMDRSLGVSGTHPASRSITAGPLEDPPNSPNLAVRRIAKPVYFTGKESVLADCGCKKKKKNKLSTLVA